MTFLRKIRRLNYVLGLQLGILVQGSTLGVQFVATNYVPNPTAQLVLSLVWSYVLAAIALLIFFLCQRLIRIFLQELLLIYSEAHNNNGSSSNHNHNHHDNISKSKNNRGEEALVVAVDEKHQIKWEKQLLEEWKVDIQCNFVQGTVVGIFVSWVCVDMILNFHVQVIYGGIVLLLSLLFFMIQVWCKQRLMDHLCDYHCDHHCYHHPLYHHQHDKTTATNTSPTNTSPIASSCMFMMV